MLWHAYYAQNYAGIIDAGLFWDDFEAQSVVQDVMVVGVVVKGCFTLTRNNITLSVETLLVSWKSQMAVVLQIKTAFPLTFTCTNGVNV